MWAKYVSPLSQTAKRHHGAPAACSRRSAEKCHPHNGLTFVLTWSPFYSIAPKLDELSSPPANSEGRGWKQSLRQGLLFLLSAWRISASPRASTSHPPPFALPTEKHGDTQKQAVSIPAGTWRVRPQDHSCTHRLTTSSSLEHHLCCWCLGLTSELSPQSVSHQPRSAARPHWRRHDEELVLRWVLCWALTQVPAVTQGQVWPPTPLCRAGSCSPSPAQLSLPCLHVRHSPGLPLETGERIPWIC